MANKTWTMNETQKQFIEVLKNYENGVTLFELRLAGYDFKSGSINTLITKGLVCVIGEREFKCDVVYNGVVVGSVTKTGKVYMPICRDAE